jgi:hypothetical protein
MKFALSVIDWQAVASLLTFVAVAIALWEVNAQRWDIKARAGHIVRTIGLMLFAFRTAFRTHLQETQPHQTLALTKPLRERTDQIFALFKDAFVVVERKRYGPLAKIISSLFILCDHDSFDRAVAEDLLRQIESYLTNTLEAPQIDPTLSASRGR